MGLYIQQIFLAALFFFAQDAQGNQSGIPQGAIMVRRLTLVISSRVLIHSMQVVLIVITILFHMLIST